MHTQRLMPKLMILALAVATFGSCVLIVDGDGSDLLYTTVVLDKAYEDESIVSTDANYYEFVAGSDFKGVHNIAVTNLTTDVDWYLYKTRDDARADVSRIASGEEHSNTTDESEQVGLSSGQTYYLVVKERDGRFGRYTLRISN